uniref:AAA ATPase AAA+ lid domain-containing protein n=2 Tax=Chromera velia CCMP2878 TaxID=1169474 RepID=A0A0G4IEA6_9ALVE|eukprot:Cvel_13543.t1-p1 / transcript=Cvel_13543.t1 / gene=Cvel_13543 / organism=Chromera_velia_CCMP2878 / gene_product=hypothetical protein / transcript_product=hypothetical protein / location=Cvel_scaffold930:8479-13310(-) / protein_length=667 / sequence_SO=supercontig / SO=protein_coding / is_pseudo=false
MRSVGVEATRKIGGLIEIPFEDILEFGNSWDVSGLPPSPFRTTPIWAVRCEPVYLRLKSGRTLVLLVPVRATKKFWTAFHTFVLAYRKWQSEQTLIVRVGQTIRNFFEGLLPSPKTVAPQTYEEVQTLSSDEEVPNYSLPRNRIPTSPEGARAALEEERKMMILVQRWLSETEGDVQLRETWVRNHYMRHPEELENRGEDAFTLTAAPYSFERVQGSERSSEASEIWIERVQPSERSSEAFEESDREGEEPGEPCDHDEQSTSDLFSSLQTNDNPILRAREDLSFSITISSSVSEGRQDPDQGFLVGESGAVQPPNRQAARARFWVPFPPQELSEVLSQRSQQSGGSPTRRTQNLRGPIHGDSATLVSAEVEESETAGEGFDWSMGHCSNILSFFEVMIDLLSGWTNTNAQNQQAREYSQGRQEATGADHVRVPAEEGQRYSSGGGTDQVQSASQQPIEGTVRETHGALSGVSPPSEDDSQSDTDSSWVLLDDLRREAVSHLTETHTPPAHASLIPRLNHSSSRQEERDHRRSAAPGSQQPEDNTGTRGSVDQLRTRSFRLNAEQFDQWMLGGGGQIPESAYLTPSYFRFCLGPERGPPPLPEDNWSLSDACWRKSPLGPEVSLDAMAERLVGYSGADITEVCQRAAKLASPLPTAPGRKETRQSIP